MTTKTKMVCGLVALFLAGVVVGGSAGFAAAKRKIVPQPVAEQKRDQVPKRDFADKWCSRLSSDLNLTADQVEKIKPITEETSAQLKAVHAENNDRVRAIFKGSHERIKAILTPEQLTIFEQKNREREARIRKDREAREASSKPPKC
jgi:Spy/CpxP family protein refolding chaperone